MSVVCGADCSTIEGRRLIVTYKYRYDLILVDENVLYCQDIYEGKEYSNLTGLQLSADGFIFGEGGLVFPRSRSYMFTLDPKSKTVHVTDYSSFYGLCR